LTWLLDNPQRLRSLDEMGLLDTPPDEAFDRYTRLVAHSLDVPVALVSLVDAGRQFFLSALGLGEPWATARETPLSHSFCQYVVISDEPLIVPDATLDERLRESCAIPDLGVIAYAGMPIRAPDGEPLGALCAIDNVPRTWTAEELATLHDLSLCLNTEIALVVAASRQRAFAADAAHQLRSPLAAIQLNLEEVLSAPETPAPAVETLQTVMQQVHRLSATVADLLDLARNRGSLRGDVSDLHQIVSAAVARWERPASSIGRDICFEDGSPSSAAAQPNALSHVLDVLIQNALEHGKGRVAISIVEGGGALRVRVRDEGEGVHPDLKAALFHRRVQGPNSTGTGRGLMLADQIVRRIGGRVSLSPGASNSFDVLLPLPPTDAGD
jgi:signal transduction histidine kinase